MNNHQILCILRVSTDIQDLNSQKTDMLQFLKSKGYKEENIEWLEAKGASARTANKKYLDFIQSIKDKTSGENGIKVVALWHLNRLGRIKKYLTDMEYYFVQNGIQMYVKNGFDMPLLDENGKETLGSSIAFSVYSSMIEIETQEMIEKMKRGKRENAKIGRYNGGKVHFGYDIDESGRFVVNEKEADLIKLMFNLYNSGEFSTTSLTRELQIRGYKMRGKNITLHFITNMLKSTAFIGYVNWNNNVRMYPKIISNTLFEAVQGRLSNNRKGGITKQIKHIFLSSKLVKCPVCGRNWFGTGRSYCCIGHRYHGKDITGIETCTNSNSISIDWLDATVFQIAKMYEIEYILNFTNEKSEQTKQQIEINKQKVVTLKGNITSLDIKKRRINDVYVEGGYNKVERDKKLENLKEEERTLTEQINQIEEETERLLDFEKTYSSEFKLVSTGRLMFKGIEEDKEENYKIVHRHIKNVVVDFIDKEETDKKLITIETMTGDVYRYMYIPKSKIKDKSTGRIIKLYLNTDGEYKPLLLTPDFVPNDFVFVD